MGKLTQAIRTLVRRLASRSALVLSVVALPCGACWDTIQHVYACDEAADGTCPCDAETDSSTDTTQDSSPPDTDSESSTGAGEGQGVQPEGWEGFGSPCDVDEDCHDLNPQWVCIHNVIDLINAPGGYCTACCNSAGKDVCAPGIDCVGADGVYLVCLGHCDSDSQCRGEEGWECRDIPYIPDEFPGTFCLPDVDHAVPDEEYLGEMPSCDWPW